MLRITEKVRDTIMKSVIQKSRLSRMGKYAYNYAKSLSWKKMPIKHAMYRKGTEKIKFFSFGKYDIKTNKK